ncbi:hypothetical protein N7481_006063 [Penicillium waksmanii]|uniref:uncharacterized protein n=1 Tax=Penicillium waksmanii TaxID=69791 RepID=UPI00254692AC|nr:uncharacterized protein N7481_006063 [Penicillium waksmanii]KAJ5983964.1 hypothetical protein N7481_006063 [Penicillium waksmanii]
MQQSKFRQEHPSGTRLSLAKFSYTTTPIDHPGPLSWCHINGNGDLVCIFDKFAATGSASSKLIMKVIRNDSVLEQIDIARLVQSNVLLNGFVTKSSFAVVIKSPCLAVKYPQNGLIRRFQLKFLADRDFYTALSLLCEINCPITEGNATAVQQPPRQLPSSSSWASFQAPTIIWKNGNTAMTPESNATGPFHEMAQGPAGTILPADQELGPTRPMLHIPSIEHSAGLAQQAAHAETSSRPSTTQGYHDIQELNQVLPPKRDLPFLKPGTKRKRAEPTIEPAAEKPKSSRVSQLANQANRNTLERSDTIMSDASSQSLVPTQPYPEPMEPVSTQPYSQPDKENQPQPQRPTERIATTVYAAVARNSTSNNIQVRRSQSPTQHAVPPSIEKQLSAYLSSPNPERVEFLENWMCELINDDSFMTLCQDVEATWRRFAFGIKK